MQPFIGSLISGNVTCLWIPIFTGLLYTNLPWEKPLASVLILLQYSLSLRDSNSLASILSLTVLLHPCLLWENLWQVQLYSSNTSLPERTSGRCIFTSLPLSKLVIVLDNTSLPWENDLSGRCIFTSWPLSKLVIVLDNTSLPWENDLSGKCIFTSWPLSQLVIVIDNKHFTLLLKHRYPPKSCECFIISPIPLNRTDWITSKSKPLRAKTWMWVVLSWSLNSISTKLSKTF